MQEKILVFFKNILNTNYLFILLLVLVFSCNKPSIDAFFSSTPKKIEQGDTSKLKWEVLPNNEIASISIEDIIEQVPKRGEINVYPEKSKTFKLKVIDKKGKDKIFSTRVFVNPPEFDFINYNEKIYNDDPVLISWKTNNAKYVIIKGLNDTLAASGYYSVIPDSTGKMTLKAYNKNGRFTDKEITFKFKQPDIITGDTVICSNEKTKLEWNFRNAEKVRINGINKDFLPIDKCELSPKESVIYKFLVFRKNGKMDVKTFKVWVLPEDMVKFYCPEKVEKGGEIDINWKVKGIDSLTFTNGKRIYKMGSSSAIRQKITEDTKFELIFKYLGKTYRYPAFTKVIERKFVKGISSISSLGPKNKLDFEIFGVDKSKFPDEIKLYVLVVDTSGYFVTHLVSENDRKNSFRKYFKQLFEIVDEKKYPVNDFDVREIYNYTTASDFSLVMDYSGSMWKDIGYLERSVVKFTNLINQKDRIAMAKFDDKLDSLFGLTDSKTDIQTGYELNGLEDMGGGTALYAASDLGLRQFDTTSSRFKRLILFSDGYENSSFLHKDGYSTTANEVIAMARKKNVPMYIVSYGSSVNIPLLDNMASLTGGRHYNIRNSKSIEKVFTEFIKTSRYFYEITYKPIIADKERTIELVYDNQLKTEKTYSKIYIGEDYDVLPIELNGGTESTVSLVDSLKKISILKPKSAPQVITLFDFDKSDILSKYKQNIKFYVEILKGKPLSEAVLIGHTDLVGSDNYCYNLSVRRANEIKKAIVKEGINSDRVKILGFGKQQPVWNPEMNENQARENRRVEVIILEK